MLIYLVIVDNLSGRSYGHCAACLTATRYIVTLMFVRQL